MRRRDETCGGPTCEMDRPIWSVTPLYSPSRMEELLPVPRTNNNLPFTGTYLLGKNQITWKESTLICKQAPPGADISIAVDRLMLEITFLQLPLEHYRPKCLEVAPPGALCNQILFHKHPLELTFLQTVCLPCCLP